MIMQFRGRFAALISLFIFSIFASLGCGNVQNGESGRDEQPTVPLTCGDGKLDEGEVCDTITLNGETCKSQGAKGGQLLCKSTCLGFDFSGCTAPETCGDGTVQEPEVCDGGDLGGASCESLYFDEGTLGCASNCLDFDTSGCSNADDCQPQTCTDLGAQCGTIDDGCGGELDCGGCANNVSCGGDGEPNLCAVRCPLGCPDGFRCDGEGVCVGDSDSIVVNMPTATVTLIAQVDGRTPQPLEGYGCNTSDFPPLAVIRMKNHASGFQRDYEIPCDGRPVEYSIPKGIYSVTVHNQFSQDMASPGYQTHDALVVDADMEIIANMPTARITIIPQINGQTPQANSNCNEEKPYYRFLAELHLENTINGATSGHRFHCDGHTREITVAQGIYDISIRGLYASEMPGQKFVTHTAQVIDEDMTITANMPMANVSFVAQVDGRTPQSEFDCRPTSTRAIAELTLQSVRNGAIYFFEVPCSGLSAPISVPKDTYRVFMRGVSDGRSDMLAQGVQTHRALVIDQDMTVTVNMPTALVNFRAQLNGQALSQDSICDGANPAQIATITLQSETLNEVRTYPIRCDDAELVQFRVPQDTYRVSIRGEYRADMPTYEFQTHAALRIDADMTVTVNMPVAQVDLVAQMNGQPLLPAGECARDLPMATITLESETSGISETHNIPCAGTLSGVSVPRDTYSVFVRGHTYNETEMPRTDYRTHASLRIDTDMSIVANMPTTTVSFAPRLNGQLPHADYRCFQELDGALTHITLLSETSGLAWKYASSCDGTPGEMTLPKDIYRVSIRGHHSEDMPGRQYIAYERLQLD